METLEEESTNLKKKLREVSLSGQKFKAINEDLKLKVEVW